MTRHKSRSGVGRQADRGCGRVGSGCDRQNTERSGKAGGPQWDKSECQHQQDSFAALHLRILQGGVQKPRPQVRMPGPEDKEALPSRQEQRVAQPSPAALRRPHPTWLGELGSTWGCLFWSHSNPGGTRRGMNPLICLPKTD